MIEKLTMSDLFEDISGVHNKPILTLANKINEIIDHLPQEKEQEKMIWYNKGLEAGRNITLREIAEPTKEVSDIRGILERKLIEAGQRETIYAEAYLKLNSDTFKCFLDSTAQEISALYKRGDK